VTVCIAGTSSYLPSRWMTAAEISAASGVPEDVIIERFGLRGKHIAAPDEHVTDMAARVGAQVLAETGTDPADVDAVVYFGSTWKEHPVWHAAPKIAHMLGTHRAFALELDYVSCGTPVAMRVCRDMMLAEPHLNRVLAVAASRRPAGSRTCSTTPTCAPGSRSTSATAPPGCSSPATRAWPRSTRPR